MTRIIIFVLALVLLASCGIFGGLFGSNAPEVVDTNIPAWDGKQKLCGEEINFALDAVEPLPEFPIDERLGFCSRTMKYLALHRQYGDKTTYFGVAAASTGILAGTYVPLMQRATSETTWNFLQELNLALDTRIDVLAADFASGQRGGQSFTNRQISDEQNAVQDVLDALQASDPEAHALVLEEFGKILNPSNPFLLAGINRNPLFAAYEASLADIRVEVGSDLDFAIKDHRLKISVALDQLISNIAAHAEPQN